MKNISLEAIMMAFEASYDGLHILDKYGNTLYINEACTRIEGVQKEQVINYNIRELVEQGVYSQSVTLMVLDTKKSVTITQTTQNGNEVVATGTPIFDGNGEVDMVVVNSRDVTELRRLEYLLEGLQIEQKKYSNVIAHSAEMQEILSTALYISKVDSTVLITGESGVGKGVMARFIHDNGTRAEGPFIKVDCSSIPETLFESELFGYERGAFTGADKNGRIGLIEMADGGTVFFDEIGEMPLPMQPKIMRAIQDLEIMPVGGKKPRKVNVRFISATNVNLEDAVRNKMFREDLYYRLNVVPIHIPPLRSRKEDIPPLINQMVNKINSKYGFEKKLTVAAFDKLVEHSWPGNVRQLENMVERILVSNSNNIIEKTDLPQEIIGIQPESSIDIYSKGYRKLLAEYDMKILEQAVKTEGSIPKAAKLLGIDSTTIRRKISRYRAK